ncbi:uncharacterized protein [Primulina huaijiensis]|uniref:uncharacterized protein n=1 Tax=Primulina huaijiensis TaxID=1492673 RepID=UPI003CC76531
MQYSNTYNPGWRQHPNFSWGGQNSHNRPHGGQQYGKQPMYKPEPREEKSSLEQMMSKFISSTETRLQNQDESIKELENQIGQLAKMIATKDPRTLPSNTETNPKEQVNAIELRSAKTSESKEDAKSPSQEEQVETSKGKSSNSTPAPTAQSRIVIPPPFPVALKKDKIDAQFSKFLEVFKKLHISIVFADALMQMPSYVKFMKDIYANKRKKLGLGEPKPTRMSLRLADRSVKYLRGVIEDILVKMGPTDSLVLDMEEDREMPLILGRPFRATAKALIYVQEEKLRLRVGEEEITFDVFNTLKHTLHTNDCSKVYYLDSLVCNFVQDAMMDPLEATLTTELKEDELDEEKTKIVEYFNAKHLRKRPVRMKLEDLGDRRDLTSQKSSIKEPPTLELKPLSPHLKYVYLGEHRLLQLDQLDEFRGQADDLASTYKKHTKQAHDKRITPKEFKEGEAVLLYNSKLRLFPGKLKSRWTGPYIITNVFSSGAITLKDGKNEPFTVNAPLLKHYLGGAVEHKLELLDSKTIRTERDEP